jgi:CheY-like chemotaxis protein
VGVSHAVAYTAPESTIVRGAATSLSPDRVSFIDHRARRRLGYPAAFGLDLAIAATGDHALEVVPTFQPDVIIVDMLMPGLSGADVLHALRDGGFTMPVILVSGTPRRAGEGFFHVLTKPFDLRTIAVTVAAAIIHRRGSSA